MNINELVSKVEIWATEKGLNDINKSMAQMCKVIEEVGETAKAILKGDKFEIKDGIGDSMVTLIILALQNDMSITECLEAAWIEIKDRKGKINENGSFIKESDL